MLYDPYLNASAIGGTYHPQGYGSGTDNTAYAEHRPAVAALAGGDGHRTPPGNAASAFADLGRVRTRASIAAAVHDGDDIRGDAVANDIVTIDLPGGGSGFFDVSYSVRGQMNIAGSAALANPARYSNQDGDYRLGRGIIATIQLDIYDENRLFGADIYHQFTGNLFAHIAGGQGTLRADYSQPGLPPVSSNGGFAIARDFTERFRFVSGVPFDFRATDECFVEGYDGMPVSCAFDVAFGPVVIRDARGNVVSGQVRTVSGRNFAGGYPGGIAAAVPEPASWALFVTGFGLIGALSRRRIAHV